MMSIAFRRAPSSFPLSYVDRKSTRLNARHGPPRALPSSPQRPSSDLAAFPLLRLLLPEGLVADDVHRLPEGPLVVPAVVRRSEEHTSERPSRPPPSSPLFPTTTLFRSRRVSASPPAPSGGPRSR